MNETADHILAAIAALQAQRGVVGDTATDVAIGALQQRLWALPSLARPMAGADETGPQLKLATVLFVDVVGSTSIGRQLDPEDIQLLMDGALRRLSEIVTAHHGQVLQYAGDNLLAVFGAGVAHEDDAANAVRAGLAIIDETGPIALQARDSLEVDGFAVRVGAHTGQVLLGGGVDGENSVRGIAVNVAARMEQTAPPGTMRISQDCYRHVRDLFEVEEQAPLAVKGVDRPMLTYLVLRARPRGFHTARRGITRTTIRLIDRTGEFERLRDAYNALQSADRHELTALLLVADAGIGKTRLLSEFADWVVMQPRGACILTGCASERRMGQPYGLLRELLTSQLPIQDSDPAPDARAKWLAGMASRLPSSADAALLGHLLGLDFSNHDGVRGIIGEARQIRDLGYHYASEVLRRMAATEPPLLLLLDDLHWADDASLDFIEHLLAAHADLPLLLIGLTRPTLYERRPHWDGILARQARIDLPQFDARYSEELVTALLERLQEVPNALRQLIVSRAEGNPYYMEELVNMLIDRGTIVAGETWQLRDEGLQADQLPTTLTGVLQARVDGLPSELRHTLQLAAVVGHVFWDSALDVLGVNSEAVLQDLVARQLIVSREASTLDDMHEYAFKHHMLHRVCYDSVLKRHKRAAHAEVARWLEVQEGAAHLDLIAEHFERGGALPQAIDYWQRAAQEAASRYANAAALAHSERALALVQPDDLERRFALVMLTAKVLREQSEREHLAQCLDDLTMLADRLGSDRRRSEAAERRARFLYDGGDVIQALGFARQALTWSPPDAPECTARAHLLMASALWTLGRPGDALPHAQAGLAAARAAGNSAIEAMMLNQMGMDANNRGDPGAAIALFEAALVRHRESRNRSNEAGTLTNIAYAAFVLGEYVLADAQFLQAAELCRQIGQRHIEGIVLINLALVRLSQEKAASARDFVQRALQLLRLAGDRLAQAAALRVAGHAELALGELGPAGENFSTSRALFDDLGLPHLAIESIAGQALHAQVCGDLGAAVGYVDLILARQASGAELAGADEPLRIGQICYRVLAAAGDERAQAVLAATHTELQARAAKISDPIRRQSFLRAVPWHRDLIQSWASQWVA